LVSLLGQRENAELRAGPQATVCLGGDWSIWMVKMVATDVILPQMEMSSLV